MQKIKSDIKEGNFSNIYLLYGSEQYLKKLYKDKLKNALISDNNTMNYSYFEGKKILIENIVELAQTLPFLSERRLIVIENSGFFKSQNNLADYMKNFPNTTYTIFIENEIDKRNRLYKYVKSVGTISEMNGLDENNLKLWIVSLLKSSNKKITNNTLTYFLNQVGTNMLNIQNEIEKLICYCIDEEVITTDAIDTVCITQITNEIFKMIDAIANKQKQLALKLYYNLIALKERPLSILFLITKHFNQLLQIKSLFKNHKTNMEIASQVQIPSFAVSKYISQAKNFNNIQLINNLKYCTNIEEKIKTGELNEQIGLEILIIGLM